MGGPTNREILFILKMRDEARAHVQRLGTSFRELATNAAFAARGTRRGMDDIGDAAQHAQRRVSGLVVALRGIGLAAVAAAAVAVARAFVQAGDQYTQHTNRLVATGTAAEDTRGKLRELLQIARDSASSLEPTVSLYGRAAVALRALGGDAAEAERFVLTFQRALSVGGAGVQEAASATLQFSQALGSGVLRGEEFNAIAEASPYLLEQLAEAMDVPVGSLRQLAQEGRITGQVLREALAKMAEGVDADYSRMGRTASQAWTAFKDQVSLSMGEINQSLDTNGGLVSLIDSATHAVQGLGDIISATLEPAMQLFDETAKLALEVTGIQAMIDWFSRLGGEAETTGVSIAAHIRAGLQNAVTFVRWFREVFRETGRFLAALFVDLGNDLVRPIAASFYTIERLSRAMLLSTQGKFREAGQIAGSAYAEGLRIAREQFPELEVVFNTPAMGAITNAARAQAEIEAQRSRSAGRATAGGVPTSGASTTGEAATAATETTTEAVETQNDALEANLGFWGSIRAAATRIAEDMRSNISLVQEAAETTFQRLGDAFKQFVTTGKLSFKDLVATILAELAQMAAARAWQEMLSVIGGSASTGQTSTMGQGQTGGSSGNFWADAAMFVAGLFHDGGLVGAQVSAARAVNPAVFAHAKRYHRGGLAGRLSAGEVPIIAKKNEAVMPTVRLPDGSFGVRAMGGAGAGTTVISPTYNVTNNISGAGKDSAEISDEVAAKTLEGLEKHTRAITQDEIRKANSFGGQMNWRP